MTALQSLKGALYRAAAWSFVIVSLAGPMARAQDTTNPATLYAIPPGVVVGSNLNSGATQQMPGCSPAVYSSQTASAMTAIATSKQISQNGRPAPGKILTSCISTLLKMIDLMDVWSKTSVWSAAMAAAKQAALEFAAQLVCDEIQSQYNQMMSQVFNSLSFLNNLVPCNLLRANFPFAGGGAQANLCQALNGMQVTIGVQPYGSNSSPVIGKMLQQVQ